VLGKIQVVFDGFIPGSCIELIERVHGFVVDGVPQSKAALVVTVDVQDYVDVSPQFRNFEGDLHKQGAVVDSLAVFGIKFGVSIVFPLLLKQNLLHLIGNVFLGI
jgi:hypothetical protein